MKKLVLLLAVTTVLCAACTKRHCDAYSKRVYKKAVSQNETKASDEIAKAATLHKEQQ